MTKIKKEEIKEDKDKKEEKENKKNIDDFKKKILELESKGLTSEKIGQMLKKEGYNSKEFKIKISKVLGTKYINPDKINLQKKLEKLETHCKKNKGDKKALRKKDQLVSKVRKLGRYLEKD